MKLPDFFSWATLNALRHQMAAPMAPSYLPERVINPIELPIITALREKGVDVAFSDIQIQTDSTLSYQGHRVLLYIRDIASYGGRQELPKFHLTFCGTLESMHRKQRFARYVVANRDDGNFQVNLVDAAVESKVVKLNVCQLCLAKIGWKAFRFELSKETRLERVAQFELKEYFRKFSKDLNVVRPRHNSNTAPLNVYSDDWADIALGIKKTRGYRCIRCTASCTGARAKYLHLHHRNGLKHDNAEDNLELLCIRCHANEPFHAHMKNLPEYLEYMANHIS